MVKITITKPNNIQVLIEYDLLKGSGYDADLSTAFGLIATRFSEASRQPIAPLTAQQVSVIANYLSDQPDSKVVIVDGVTHYGKVAQ